MMLDITLFITAHLGICKIIFLWNKLESGPKPSRTLVRYCSLGNIVGNPNIMDIFTRSYLKIEN